MICKSFSYYNKVIEFDPEYKNAYASRGRAKYGLDDFEEAITDYNMAIKLDPEDKDAYLFRGLAKSGLRDYGGACLDWSKSSELGNDYADELILSEHCN